MAAIPHAGRAVPEPYAGTLTVPAEELWADWYTDRLWRFLPGCGIPTVSTDLSRFVADVNRDPASGQGGFWSSVVPADDPMGDPVHQRRLTDAEVAERIAAAHTPFHRLLDDRIAAALERFPEVLLLDLHSFGAPMDADVIIGDGDGTSASTAVTAAVVGAFEAEGLSVAVNLRFRGGWTVRRFRDVARVHAIAIEIDQRRYLEPQAVDAWPCVPPFDPVKGGDMTNRLRRVVNAIEAAFSKREPT